MSKQYSILALGDSYTVGEAIPLHQSFPYQVVQMLRLEQHPFLAPEIIARTAWTTEDLLTAIDKFTFADHYHIVTLLIGVNNQYRKMDIVRFKQAMEKLITKSIELTRRKASHVIVMSIPDYSHYPYTETMDRVKISHEIELYNNVLKALCLQYKTSFLEIGSNAEKIQKNPALIATDKLHPSAKEYTRWAKKLHALILKLLKLNPQEQGE